MSSTGEPAGFAALSYEEIDAVGTALMRIGAMAAPPDAPQGYEAWLALARRGFMAAIVELQREIDRRIVAERRALAEAPVAGNA